MRYEYKVERFDARQLNYAEDKLNVLGDIGFKVVGIQPTNTYHDFIVILMKEVEGEAKSRAKAKVIKPIRKKNQIKTPSKPMTKEEREALEKLQDEKE